MSDHEPTCGRTAADDHDRGVLRVALTDLAATMPDNPYRIDDIRTTVHRVRARRRAGRTTVLAVAGVAVIGTLVAVRASTTHVSILPAAGAPTTVAAVTPLPTCSAVLANLPPPATTPPGAPGGSAAADPGSAADAAKRAAVAADASEQAVSAADKSKQAAADAADEPNHAITGARGVKDVGTIVSADAATVTFTVTAEGPGQPAQITATIAPDVIYADGDTKLVVRPPLNAGDHVFFATTQADDGSYQLIFLQVHPLEMEVRSGNGVDAAAKSAKAGDESRYVKASAKVVSVQASSLSLELTDGSLAGQVVTAATGPDTIYSAEGQTCGDPQIAAGSTVNVLLIRGDDGTFTARRVDLLRT